MRSSNEMTKIKHGGDGFPNLTLGWHDKTENDLASGLVMFAPTKDATTIEKIQTSDGMFAVKFYRDKCGNLLGIQVFEA